MGGVERSGSTCAPTCTPARCRSPSRASPPCAAPPRRGPGPATRPSGSRSPRRLGAIGCATTAIDPIPPSSSARAAGTARRLTSSRPAPVGLAHVCSTPAVHGRARCAGAGQLRKFSNCSGMPRSAPFRAAITRLQVVTLLARDPHRVALRLAGDALRRLLLDQLVDLAGLVGGDADLDRRHLADRLVAGLLDVAVVEPLERHAALDELLLEHDGAARPADPRSTERSVSASSFCSIDESVFLKSKRVAISRCAWSTALRTSWRSTSDTTSKLGMRRGYRGGTIVDRPRPRGPTEGSVPERPKGADCKSAGVRLRRFKSSPAHVSSRRHRSSGRRGSRDPGRFPPRSMRPVPRVMLPGPSISSSPVRLVVDGATTGCTG